MSTAGNLSKYRIIITRTVFLFFLLMFFWRGYSMLLPFQIGQPLISKLGVDLSFMLYKFSGMQQWLVNNPFISLIYTISLIALCFLVVLFPLKRGFIFSFALFYLVFALIFNVNLTHGSHLLYGMILISFVFLPKKDTDFELLWEGMRYYVCWVYASAFVWKIMNGALFQADFGELAFKSNIAWIMYENPDTWWTTVYSFFIRNPFILNIGDKFVFLAEGLFIAGFFTKKWDSLLIVCAVLILLSTWFFSDVVFIELDAIVIFVLLKEKTWKKWNDLFLLSKKSLIS